MLLEKPLLSPVQLEAFEDHVRELIDLRAALPWRAQIAAPFGKAAMARTLAGDDAGTGDASRQAGQRTETVQRCAGLPRSSRKGKNVLREVAASYMPWLLPEFESLRKALNLGAEAEQLPLARLPGYTARLAREAQGAAARVRRRIGQIT